MPPCAPGGHDVGRARMELLRPPACHGWKTFGQSKCNIKEVMSHERPRLVLRCLSVSSCLYRLLGLSHLRTGSPRGVSRGAIRFQSVAVASGPDQAVIVVLALDQGGVDRGGEARVVQLDREVVAALAGRLLPGGAELHGAGEDAVVGSLVAGLVGRLDRRLGVDAEGLDSTCEALTHLGEGADGRHGALSCCSSGRAHCGLDGDRPAGGDRRRTRACEPQRSGGWRVTGCKAACGGGD